MTTKFKIAAIALACTTAFNASAAVEVYNNDGMTFSADGLVNIFYSNSSIDSTDAAGNESDRTQSRVRTGFLPSYIGFNFAKQLDDVKISTRSSFWVSLSDTDNSRDASPADVGTGSLIDVRQFYATVSGDFGEVLLGKDFGLFNRANIMGDELLLGYGQTSDTWGLVDGGNVSFGNIATGYTYPFPKAQITYRTPEMNGFKLAIAIMDPNKTSTAAVAGVDYAPAVAGVPGMTNAAAEVAFSAPVAAAQSSEDLPRFEFELMYNTTMDDVALKAWLSGVSQSSELNGVDQDQSGIGYGANVKFSGLSLTASGYSAEGLGHVVGLDTFVGPDTIESDGYLVQASYTMGDSRFVATYGESSVDPGTGDETVSSNTGVAYFRTIRPGLTAVLEYNLTEIDTDNSMVAEENNTISVGAVVTF